MSLLWRRATDLRISLLSPFAIIFVCMYNNRKKQPYRDGHFRAISPFRSSAPEWVPRPIRRAQNKTQLRAHEGGRGREEGGREARISSRYNLEERGKAEVANPCKGTVVLPERGPVRAPDALSSSLPPRTVREKDPRAAHRSLLAPFALSLFSLSLSYSSCCASLFVALLTATRAARFQHVSTMTTRRGKDLCICVCASIRSAAYRSFPPPR